MATEEKDDVPENEEIVELGPIELPEEGPDRKIEDWVRREPPEPFTRWRIFRLFYRSKQ